MRKRIFLVPVLALLVASCGNGGSRDGFFLGSIDLQVENPDRCDPIDPRHCLLPFPNDFFTVPDASMDTGRRVNIVRESAPRNQAGVHVDTAEWNRNDGFSPGAQIATYVGGIDLAATGAAPLTDLGSSLRSDAPIVLLDADTGERKPCWAELDATVSSDGNRMLFVRPAVNLLEGHRHIVAFRRLRAASGATIEPSDAFRAYRDRLETNVPEVEAQRERYERLFGDLADAGVAREDLYLAWDFTVASERNLSERILHIRDDAFALLGTSAPVFEVLEVDNGVDLLARWVRGTFQVPLYLTGTGEPGSRFNNGPNGLPQANGSYSANFWCVVPNAAVSGPGGSAVPARAAVYGHGLLGSGDEVDAGNVRRMANEHNFVFCATDWIGLSEQDLGNAIAVLNDISNFPTASDRMQQGILNTLFLGRLMIHEQGLVSHPAFQVNGAPVIDRSDLFYDGNSQGGIMGGAATAVAIDWTRAVLGVPGMNYSTLLQRSVDWDAYRLIYDPAYPDEVERGLGLILLQMLWDRSEANGYALHLTDDPLPNTPPHEILMHVAFGDHQVSPASAEVEARTIGARIHWPAVTPGRLPDVEPYWGIDRIESYPHDGSAIIIFDSGAPVPPTVNLPPREGEDPHGDPRNDPDARRQKSAFLRTDGTVIDVCDGAPCTADPS